MSKAHVFRKLAENCYERARVTVNPETKRVLMQQGDDYLKEAVGLHHEHAIVQAVFPKTDLKID